MRRVGIHTGLAPPLTLPASPALFFYPTHRSAVYRPLRGNRASFCIILCEVCFFLPLAPPQSDRGYGFFSFSLAITTPRRWGCFKPQHGVAIYGYLCTEAAASRFCHCQCEGSKDMFYYRAGAPLHLQCPLPARPLFCPIGLVRFFSPTIPFSVGPGPSVVSYNINSVAEVAISNR